MSNASPFSRRSVGHRFRTGSPLVDPLPLAGPILLAALMVVGLFGLAEPRPESGRSAAVARLGLCAGPPHINCVMDGDTFYLQGEPIRIADIDAPETHPPRCTQEAELGRRATWRLREILNAQPFEIRAYERDRDMYGRKLRIVASGGQSVGGKLVAEGLARPWTGKRQPWCG